MNTIHTFEVEGLVVQTGDVICKMNGKPDILPGEFWRLVGRLAPGDVDHVVMYVGPGGRCVEAGSRGVITFEMPDSTWDTERMAREVFPAVFHLHVPVLFRVSYQRRGTLKQDRHG